MPLFAAKCPTGITADSNTKGQVYINGKLAKVIKRPDGQYSANSHGVWVDITPQGDRMPRITYTGKDKSVGECEVVSFTASGSGAAAGSSHSSAHAHDAKEHHACRQQPGGCPLRALQRAPSFSTSSAHASDFRA